MTKLSVLFTVAFFAFVHSTYSQEISPSALFDNAQGIKQENVAFYNLEGYTVFVMDYKYNFDEKGFKKLKQKINIPKKALVTDDKEIPNIKIINSTSMMGEATLYSKHFISETDNGKMKVDGFSSLSDRDSVIENTFYKSIIDNTIPENVYTPMVIDSIEFANRYIKLGPVCQWRETRSVQCPYRGQINWSEFQSKERAEQMIEGQMAVNADLNMGVILEEKEVDVIFEGKPATAIKRKFKIKLPKLVMGGSNILYIYYLVAEVRGTYVACVMSHYDIDAAEGKLPALLSEVMELK